MATMAQAPPPKCASDYCGKDISDEVHIACAVCPGINFCLKVRAKRGRKGTEACTSRCSRNRHGLFTHSPQLAWPALHTPSGVMHVRSLASCEHLLHRVWHRHNHPSMAVSLGEWRVSDVNEQHSPPRETRVGVPPASASPCRPLSSSEQGFPMHSTAGHPLNKRTTCAFVHSLTLVRLTALAR